MQSANVTSLAAAATIAILLQACATSANYDRENRVTAQACPAGEIQVCEFRSSGRISDGRFGRNSTGRRKNCGCQPEHDLDSLEGPSLPTEPPR